MLGWKPTRSERLRSSQLAFLFARDPARETSLHSSKPERFKQIPKVSPSSLLCSLCPYSWFLHPSILSGWFLTTSCWLCPQSLIFINIVSGSKCHQISCNNSWHMVTSVDTEMHHHLWFHLILICVRISLKKDVEFHISHECSCYIFVVDSSWYYLRYCLTIVLANQGLTV